MLTLKVISALLHYPDDAVVGHVDELREALREEGVVSGERLAAIEAHLQRLANEDLLDAQAEYVETFDRGRARSLHLFEHVHGESRDRGQAMVELQNVYRENGFDIDVPELPDYLPLFLEFLSSRPPEEALGWLEEVVHLIELLHARLAEEGSSYAALVAPLLELAGVDTDDAEVRARIAQEERDDTPEALDRVWMEDPVTFGADSGDFGVRPNRRPEDVPSVEPVKWAPPRKASMGNPQ